MENSPRRGEIRTIDGKRCRFIERELEGDKWEVIDAPLYAVRSGPGPEFSAFAALAPRPDPEMVVRVAVAIDAEFVRLGEDASARDIARAAMRAMREPTEDMISAADDANADYRTINLNGHAHLGPEGVWYAMIDTALAH